MFYADGKLQYKVRVDRPNPLFARALQQAIGGVGGEIRAMMQYLFQAWGQRGPKKYRDMLLATGTEEIAHVEMLATAVALNLEGAPTELQDQAAKDPLVNCVLGGMNLRHYLSTGLAATGENSNGVPFNMSHVYASGGHHRGHVRERGGRGDRAGAGHATVAHDGRSRHEGHALVPHRARHDAPAAVARRPRGARRVRAAAPDPQQQPARVRARGVQLRVPRPAHRNGCRAAGGALHAGTLARRQGEVQHPRRRAAWRRAQPRASGTSSAPAERAAEWSGARHGTHVPCLASRARSA